MSYLMYTFEDIADMKNTRPGPSVPIAAAILGVAYPTDEAYTIYVWDFYSYATPDDDEIVKPNTDDDNGRWVKDEFSVTTPQVNTDWNATSGISEILNKPSLASVASSGNYADLANKPLIPGAVSVSSLNSRSISLATAYQATDTSKPAIVSVNLNSVASISLTNGTTIVGEVRIGSASSVSSGASGTVVGSYKNTLTGTLVIGLALTHEDTSTVSFILPAGWYFAVRQTTGTGLTVSSAFDQSISN